MNDVVIYAPCRIFEVRVSIGAGTSMSALERHTLRAVHVGVDTMPALCEFLGLPSRLTVDLLGDLWRAGHVSFNSFGDRDGGRVDLGYERVLLSSGIIQRIIEGTLETLPGTEITDEQRPMMLDTLSGLVSAPGGLPRVPDLRLEVPGHDDEAQLGGIDQAELVEAVSRAINETDQIAGAAADGTRRKRVVRAYLSPAALTRPSEERRYRKVGLRVGLDADDRLVVRVAEDSLPAHHQEAAQSRLTRLVEDRPESAFVRALRQAASGPPQEPSTLSSLLAELGERADALRTVAPTARGQAHAEIGAASRRIVGHVEGLAERESGVELLVGHGPHEAAIRELIGGARTQIVLACPWLDYDGLSKYVDALEEAVGRGVQVVLLRGIGREPLAADKAVDNALNALRRLGPGSETRVLVSPHSSAVIHAKLVVCDNRAAVVTSLNFLQPSRAGTRELGVRIDALRGRRNPAIGDLLAWSRRAMPDYTVGQAVIIDSASFSQLPGSAEPPGPASPDDAEPAPRVADDPPFTETAEADVPDGPAVTAWATSWRRRAEELTVAARRRRPAVRLIRDGEHRDLLWSALRTVRRQLVITSDALAEDVVDRAFLDQLQQCRERGVEITLIYRRTRRESGQRAVERLEALAGPASAGTGHLWVRQEPNHAKVLVADDEAVVTSYNFLSFDGYYGGAGRRRQRSEIGARIYGGEVVTRLLASLNVTPRAPVAVAQRPDRPPAGRSATAERLVLAAAQRVLARSGKGGALTGAVLFDLCAAAGDPFAVLAAIEECGAGPSQLEPAVAAVLGRAGAAGPDADRWWSWLARRQFEAGQFTVAAVLREAAPDPHARPRAALALVAALRGTAGLELALEDAALRDDLSLAEASALVATGAHALLRAGGLDLASPLEIVTRAAGPPWAELGTVALRWWAAAGGPLPVEWLRRGAVRRRHAAGLAASWADLNGALAAFERYSPPYTVGSGTHRFLLRSGGPLNLLAVAAGDQDLDAVRSWLEDPRLASVDAWVDAATRAAGNNKLIEGHLRRPFVGRVTAIVDSARRVAARDGADPPALEPPEEASGPGRDCLVALESLLPRLRAAQAEVEPPERALAAAAVADLERFVRTGAA